jgi:hypothetical protein
LPVALDTTRRAVFSAQSTFGLTPRQRWKFGGGDGKEFPQTWFEGIKTFKTDKETSVKSACPVSQDFEPKHLENSSEIYRPAYRVWR